MSQTHDGESRRAKIEFWVAREEKTSFAALCKRAGYTVAETMRRAFDERKAELERRTGNVPAAR